MTRLGLDIREQPADNLSTADAADAMEPRTDSVLEPDRTAPEGNLPLFVSNDAQDFRSRWEKIQNSFVDEPRKAVEQADELVASTIKRLTEVFASESQKMEADWDKKTDEVSTEDLRVALRRYRSFFNRLLSV